MVGVLWAACTAGRAADEESAPQAGPASAATVVSSSNGAALKWLPQRPTKIHDDGQTRAVQHVVPVQPRRAAPPAAGSDPFVDPFGDAPQRAPKVITPARPLAEGRGEELSPEAIGNDKLLQFPGTGSAAEAGSNTPRPGRLMASPARPMAAAAQPAPAANGKPAAEDDLIRGPQTQQEQDAMRKRQTLQRCKSFDEMVSNFPMKKLDSSIKPAEKSLPPDCDWSHAAIQPRSWSALTYTWTASALCHKPLYFEEKSLERYGHCWKPIFQPFISAGHFFISVPLLPYNMGLEPPGECMYSLGYYRPGSCAPHMLDPFPLSVRGALFEAGAVAGLVFILP